MECSACQNKGRCKVCRGEVSSFVSASGGGRRYEVFPGITLTYYEVHDRQDCRLGKAASQKVLEIHHCLEGRMEREFGKGFFYLTPGDLALNRGELREGTLFFPLGHYRGITVEIDLLHTPECLECFLEDVNVFPEHLFEKFCGGGQTFVLRAKPALEHIFSELYGVAPAIQKGYFKVKMLELMLFLSCLDPSQDLTPGRCCTRAQVLLARQVGSYLTQHMDSKIPIDTLAKKFQTSPTALKTSFKGVYGISVYAYIRAQKMQSAARDLCRTDASVLEIAGRYGYDNASKFAKAFKDTMGVSPSDYRSKSGQTPPAVALPEWPSPCSDGQDALRTASEAAF